MASLRNSIFISLCLAMIAGLVGCATPARRAHENAAVFGRLPPTDQRLVLHGHVREGLAQDAVVIAWGKPNDKLGMTGSDRSKEKTAREVWVYRRQLATYAPIGSYDQWPVGSSRAPQGMGLVASPGFGFGGSGYEGWLLYHPRLIPTDSYVRRAVFMNGRLESYEVVYGESPPWP